MRYGGQQLDGRGLLHWPLSRLIPLTDELCKLIEEENASGTPPTATTR